MAVYLWQDFQGLHVDQCEVPWTFPLTGLPWTACKLLKNHILIQTFFTVISKLKTLLHKQREQNIL